MDAKTLAGKSLFFILICLFVVVYSKVFGQENSLTGVIVVVLALMMLGKDLSVRPATNLAGLIAFTLIMGLGAYVSLWVGNAFTGAVINFAVVFVLSYMTTGDLRFPMHFPFLLGYAFMLSVPVSAEDLPVRVLALVVGSVFIVVLNVLVNRNRHSRTCHGAVKSMCAEVESCCLSVIDGEEVDPSQLDRMCLSLRGSMFDRIRSCFFVSGTDRGVLDIASCLQTMGRAVCSRERDADVLGDLADLMRMVSQHEDGTAGSEEVVGAARRFASVHPGADGALLASVASMADTLARLESGGNARIGVRDRVRAAVREEAWTDSARFSFAMRMSLVFTVWAFVWQYWEVENAKWLLFTTVALVVPYVDGAWRKSAMRLTGTVVGIAAFAVVSIALGGDVGLLSVALIVANYVYTVLDPKRYDVMMVFITFSALIAASMSSPADEAVAERILFILLGVVSAIAANYLILPYRIGDENVSLGRRYLRATDGMLASLLASIKTGTSDDDTVESLAAAGVSSKMHMNSEASPDGTAGLFLSCLDGVAAQCSFLGRNVRSLSEAGRRHAASLLEDGGDDEPEGLTEADRWFCSMLSATLGMRRESEVLLARMR